MKKLLLCVSLFFACACTALSDTTSLHLRIAQGFVGTKELPGNRGRWIDRWNKGAGVSYGSPYCASFGKFCLDSAGALSPKIRSALATAWLRNKSTISAKDVYFGMAVVPSGSCVIWRNGETISGHFGFFVKWIKKNVLYTIEANTSSGLKGSQRDGNGVYNRTRTLSPFAYFRIEGFVPVQY
jgi:hypothetical protein